MEEEGAKFDKDAVMIRVLEKCQEFEIGSISVSELIDHITKDSMTLKLSCSLFPLLLDAGLFIFNEELAQVIESMKDFDLNSLINCGQPPLSIPFVIQTMQKTNEEKFPLHIHNIISNLLFAKDYFQWSCAISSEVFLPAIHRQVATTIGSEYKLDLSSQVPSTIFTKFRVWYDSISEAILQPLKHEIMQQIHQIIETAPERAYEQITTGGIDFAASSRKIAQLAEMIESETTAVEFMLVITDTLLDFDKQVADEWIEKEKLVIILSAIRIKFSNQCVLSSWWSSLISILSRMAVKSNDSEFSTLFIVPFIGIKTIPTFEGATDLLTILCRKGHIAADVTVHSLLTLLVTEIKEKEQIPAVVSVLLSMPSEIFQMYLRSSFLNTS